jgi:hypothetical protein
LTKTKEDIKNGIAFTDPPYPEKLMSCRKKIHQFAKMEFMQVLKESGDAGKIHTPPSTAEGGKNGLRNWHAQAPGEIIRSSRQ